MCVNTTQVVLPISGQWFPLPASENDPRPLGRCGHATCALGDNRIVVLGGDLSPPRRLHTDSLSTSEQPVDSNIQGNPAKDVWILTRCRPDEVNQGMCISAMCNI